MTSSLPTTSESHPPLRRNPCSWYFLIPLIPAGEIKAFGIWRFRLYPSHELWLLTDENQALFHQGLAHSRLCEKVCKEAASINWIPKKKGRKSSDWRQNWNWETERNGASTNKANCLLLIPPNDLLIQAIWLLNISKLKLFPISLIPGDTMAP